MPEKSDSADSYGSWKFPDQSSECKWGRGEGQQHDVSVAVIQMQPSAHTIYQVLSWAALWRPPVMGFRETGGRTPDELLVTSAHTFNLKRTIFLKGLNEEWNHKFYSLKNFFFILDLKLVWEIEVRCHFGNAQFSSEIWSHFAIWQRINWEKMDALTAEEKKNLANLAPPLFLTSSY